MLNISQVSYLSHEATDTVYVRRTRRNMRAYKVHFVGSPEIDTQANRSELVKRY